MAKSPGAKAAGIRDGSKALTVRLPPDDYWALRRYCADREQKLRRRVSNQDALLAAVREVLAKQKQNRAE
jgi:hypothetical protein